MKMSAWSFVSYFQEFEVKEEICFQNDLYKMIA